MAKYEIEVWDKTGGRLGDIRPLCSNVQWTRTRNDAETFSFDINQEIYNKLIKTIGYDKQPLSFMEAGRTDFRIKRNGQYLFGVNLISIAYSGDESTVKKTIQATGYLNYFNQRYITASYNQWWQEDILNDVIAKAQQTTGGNFGITRGATVGAHKIKRDRSYENKNIKEVLTDMSNVINGPDFEFTADKKLNIYQHQGVFRPNTKITYPGNVQSFSFTRSVENIANSIIGQGAGNGSDATLVTMTDATSANYCYMREKISQYKDVSVEDTLQEHVASELAQNAMPFELPSLKLQNDTLDLNELSVGDVVYLDMSKSKDAELSRITGYYRIEQISCSVDDNDSEEVSLTFDNYKVKEIVGALKNEKSN